MKETNMEHYRGEIQGHKFDFALINGNITGCTGTPCQKCDFNIQCVKNKVKWLMSEYKPEPVLTAREKRFVEFLQDGWLARDLRHNCFYWFKEKPTKGNDAWYCECSAWLLHSILLEGLFPFITWEDEEPWSVASLRKLKVQK